MTNKSTLAQGLSHAWPWTKPIGSSPTTSRLLRYSLLCMLVLLCGGSAWAQDDPLAGRSPEVTLDFTSQDNWNIPTSGTNTTLGTYTDKDETYSIKLYAVTNYKLNSGYLILGKQDSYLELPSFNFDVDYITVEGSSGASEAVKQNILVGETAVSTETTGAKSVTNVYAIASNNQAAGNVYKLQVTSNHNTQIVKINIYKKEEAGAIKAPVITPTTGSYTEAQDVTISCGTSGATIYYTLDGSDPSATNGTEYTTSFNLTETKTVKAIAIKGDKASSITTAELTINIPHAFTLPWSEDWSSYAANDVPSKYTSYYGETGSGTKIYTGDMSAGGEEPELLIKSGGGTFIIKEFNLASLNGEAATLLLQYNANRVLDVTTTTEGVTIDDAIVNGKVYTRTINIPAGTTKLDLTFENSNSSNARIDNLSLKVSTAPKAPTFDPAGGIYEEAKAVTLTCTTEGADIYYSTDGENFSLYSSPIEVSATTTISAYSQVGEEKSATVTATYNIVIPITTTSALNAAAVDGGDEGKAVTYNFTNAKVVYVNGSYNYIADETGYALLYKSGLGLDAGKVITGTLTGTAKTFSGLPEIEVSTITVESTVDDTDTPAPTTITVDQLADNVNKFIKIEEATYVSADGSNLTFKVGETEFTVRNQFGLDVTGLEADKVYNVEGFGSIYNTTPQVYATSITEYVAPTPDPLYILGVEGWTLPTDMIEMTWNAESQAYEYPLNNTSTAYFCFSTNNEVSDWDTFKADYRWALGTGGNYEFNVEQIGTALDLSLGDKTIVLPAGQWTISVTQDKKLTITGEAAEVTPTEDIYVVAGGIKDSDPEDPGFFVTWWAGEDEANQMDKQQDGTYSITYENVEIAAGTTYHFKFVKNGETWIPDGTDNNLWCYFEQAGTYNVTFTYDPNGETPSGNSNVTIEKVEDTDPGFRDIKADLTLLQALATGTDVYITVAEDGTIGTTTDPLKSAATLRGGWHGTSYGWTNFQATVPVEGCVKITYATHDYGDVVTVTNTEGQEVAKFNTTGPKWSDDNSNVVVAYYRTDEPTALTFSQVRYNPYFAVEKIDPKDIPAEVTNYNISFVAGEDVEGEAPAAIEVEAGSKVTIPANYTLYKEGYTLTGWNDGTNNYAAGAEITPEADMTLNAVFTKNNVSLSDRTEAVTVTYTLNGSKAQYGFQSVDLGIIVTQATVNGETIDVKAATSGKFAYNGSGWHQMNNDSKVAVPSCKDATIVVNGYQTGYTINANNTAMTGNADNSYTYTATTDNAIVEIAATADNTYINNIVITLPKVESTEPGGDDISGVFFSADVIATDKQSFQANTTDQEITSELATIKGGKLYATNGESSAKDLIGKQGSYYMLCLTNNTTRFKVELDHALAAGDIISAKTYSRTDSKLGLWISTATSRPNTCTAELAIDAVQTAAYEDFSSYTVTADDGLVGAKTIYIYRAVGKSTYFDEFTITRPADEPVAEDVTATWDFVNNCANLAAKAEGGSYTEETMASNVEGISMTIAYNGGQIKNNDNSYQVTNGVVMQIPVKNAGDEVTVVGYPGYYSYSVGGIDATEQTTTHKATADEAAQGYVAVASTSNDNYLNSVTVVQKAPKPSGMKEKAIIDTDFQDWAKSSTTTEVTTKYTKEDITFTYTNATVDPEATNEGKFPTSTDAAYKGYIMSAKSEATITTTTFASITKIRYRHGATGNDRGWGLKMKVGDGDWETVSDATVGSTPAWIEKTINKENVQLQWYNLNTSQNAYMFELEVYANVDLSNSPLLGTLMANGTTYTADDIFEMGTDGNYAATIELASTETMPSTENPVEAVADNGEIGDITYDASNDQSIVTIPVTAGEASVNYVATFVRKPLYTLTYLDLNGDEIGTQQVEKDAKIGAFAYNIADVQAKTDGYKARGWFKNNYVGEKWTTESVITENVNLYAVETEIEVSSDSRTYRFDLTDKNFDANDHEAFNPKGNGRYHNEHGWIFGNGDKIELLVGKKATISVGLCQYSAAGSTISASNVESIEAVAETCGSTGAIEYEGNAGTLTLTINSTGSVYIHSIKIMNTTTTNYEVNGDWIIVKEGDASSLADAIEAAKEGARIFLPNGTYDLGQKTLTTIGSNNVSIIGESMDGVIIKNRPVKEGIAITATLLNKGTNLYMQDLTLDCIAPYGTGDDTKSAERGVTLQDQGNQTILKNVYLKGLQDTYYSNNNNGTYYFEDGKVEGSVDYVCGNGDVYFNKTSFYTVNKSTGTKGGCIAAPNTRKDFGYIFNECTLDGVANEDGQYRLGRPWAADTKCLFVNTTMKIKPNAAGWGEWSPANAVSRFAEYYSVDANGDAIDLTGRATTIGGQTNDPVLTEAEAEALAPDVIFSGEWKPQVIAQQVAAPKAKLSDDGKKIEWTPANDGATAYAIFKDDKFLGITTGSEWTIEEVAGAPRRAEEPEKTGYTIRAANSRGGFGEPAEVSPATGINATLNDKINESVIYDLNGRRVMTPTKGVYIINGKKTIIK